MTNANNKLLVFNNDLCLWKSLTVKWFWQELNSKWSSLQQLTAERAVQLGSAHEVQRFHRDVDETKDWIAEKEAALATDDLGKDLRSVQTLQRKYRL